MNWRFNLNTNNNVFLPASVTFGAFLVWVLLLISVRYSKGSGRSRSSATTKTNGRDVRRSTRERKDVARWSPEKDKTPSKRTTRHPAAAAVQQAVEGTEEAIASPVTAVKKTRLAKSLGATDTPPSPPKTRSRQTPAKR